MPEKKPAILIADDDKFFLTVLSDLIRDLGYECHTANNGAEAVELALTSKPDLIMLDIVMPIMDGLEAARILKTNPETLRIPIIIITSLTDKETKLTGLKYGANEFLSKPVDEAEFKVRVENLLTVKRFEDYLVRHEEILEKEVENKTVQLKEAFERIKHAYIETIYRLTLAAEYRDKTTGEHIKRISFYSQLMAQLVGLDETLTEEIFFASPMHDIGKIGIPDSILLKPAKLTTDEFEIMKTHTTIGADILHNPDSPILERGEEIALTHHENFNGRGYPKGLKGEDIPIAGRIVHIVDVYDAIRSSRPYRIIPYSHDEAIREIIGMDGAFDPKLLEVFIKHSNEFAILFEEHQGNIVV